MSIFDGKKKLVLSEIVDIHTHILPAVDDGSRNWDMTMHMLEIATQEGITTMVATPHHMPGKGYTSPAEIQELTGRVQAAAAEKGLDVRILPGNELFYREELLDLWRRAVSWG